LEEVVDALNATVEQQATSITTLEQTNSAQTSLINTLQATISAQAEDIAAFAGFQSSVKSECVNPQNRMLKGNDLLKLEIPRRCS